MMKCMYCIVSFVNSKLLFYECRNNPRVPCPCTLGQAEADGRFGRLFSETSYELSQSLVCFAPMTLQWIWLGGNGFRILRSQVKSCRRHVFHNKALYALVDMLLQKD